MTLKGPEDLQHLFHGELLAWPGAQRSDLLATCHAQPAFGVFAVVQGVQRP
jgi:hypothetical protein